MQSPIFLIVDLFCGFGGTTTGFVDAKINGYDIAKVIACVNHDPKAIKSHWLNHPDVIHYEEDIRTLELTGLSALVDKWKMIYPDAFVLLWASLECTNFSKAKGGQPRNADSRTLAEHLFRYQEALQPDYIMIENVVEFMSWGPLDDKGKPLSRKNGQDWMRWCNEMKAYGYQDDWKELNAADFGAYTSRNRLFGCFSANGLPIVWPIATHSKKATNDMFGNRGKWKAVKEVLNFEDTGESIFTRKKPLSDKTLERIYAGLIKYVANGNKAFISNYKSGHPSSKNTTVESPSGSITTIACQARLGLVQPEFLQHYYGNGYTTSPEEPCPTLTTKERVALVQPTYFIDRQYGNGTKHQSVEVPAATITPIPKMNLVEAKHFILNPSHGGHCTSSDAPCPVIVARQDKAPLYMVQADTGNLLAIAVFDSDSEIMVEIKKFMAVYGLVDIKMRMLRVVELLRIQGFPDDYKMEGTQTDHKKFIGNSVSPPVPKAMAEAYAEKLISLAKFKAA